MKLFLTLSFLLLTPDFINLTTATPWLSWGSSKQEDTLDSNVVQQDSPDLLIRSSAILNDNTGIYSKALDRLSEMKGSSTCKHRATEKLLATCETLQASPAAERTLEHIQNLYSAHLAFCELQSAAAPLPPHCSLQLPENTQDTLAFLEAGGERQLSQCLNSLQSTPQWWTSYSNNRQDAYIWCKALRSAIDHGDFAPPDLHKLIC